MQPTSPVIMVLAAPADFGFVEGLRLPLAQRGISLAFDATALPDYTACFIIISRTSLAADMMQTDWQSALHTHKPVIPLVIEANLTLPPELQALHWIDFSLPPQMGWQQLLVVLDTLGIAMLPPPSVPVLDDEVVLARLHTGHIPLDWHVYRRFQRVMRRNARQATQTALVLLVAFLPCIVLMFLFPELGWFLRTLVSLIFFGALLGWFTLVRFPMEVYERDGESIIITPHGIFLHVQEQHVGYSFHSMAAMAPSGEDGNGTQHVRITPQDGKPLYDIAIPQRFGMRALIVAQIIVAYRAFVRSYSQHLTTTEPLSSLVFISYSRTDAAIVDILENNLQARNLRAWVDRSTLFGGQRWLDEIFRAIAQADVVLVVISPASMRSGAVRQEYEYARQLGKPIIGVVAHGTRSIPKVLRPYVAVDFRRYLVRALLQMHLALDQTGVRAARPNPLLPLDGAGILAHAHMGQAPAGGRIFKARFPLPRRIWLSLLLPMAAFLVAIIMNNQLVILAPLLWSWLVVLGRIIVQKWRNPEMIVTSPKGVALLWQNRMLAELAYSHCSQLHVRATWSHVEISVVMKGTRRRITLHVASNFPGYRAIAPLMMSDFQTFTATKSPKRSPSSPRAGTQHSDATP